MILRSPPVIASYPDDWPTVISSLVVSSHWLKMSAIMDFYLKYVYPTHGILRKFPCCGKNDVILED